VIPDALPAVASGPVPEELAGALEGGAPALVAATAHAHAHSPFLRGLMRRHGSALSALVREGPDAALAAAFAHGADPGLPAARRLREARGQVALVTALADIAQAWPLERVTAALSDFADLALEEALAASIAERTPGEAPQGLAILALGKLGSRELNYSSDIDLIILHDRASLPVRRGEEPDEAAVRIVRRLCELLQARDAFGYVQRVDLRLRPSPEVTPTSLPWGAAVSYYHSEALAWERAAFIRSRAAAGDRALGERFLAEIAPFVWRRALDYHAIAEVRAISRRIRDHYDAGLRVGPGFDLKRGRGGIREIEFLAQTHQMIFGGREPALRVPATMDALAALAAAGRMPGAEAQLATRAWRWLRAAEHRLQMLEDAQTQTLPRAPEALNAYARFAGHAGWAAMEEQMRAVTDAVIPLFDAVAGERGAGAGTAPPLAAALDAAGLAADPDSAAIVRALAAGERRALRSPAAQAAFEAVAPELLSHIGASDDPRTALARLDRFVSELPAGAGFFSLLAANPPLVGLLARLLSAAPALADALARRPALFDVLLDPGAFAPPPDAAGQRAALEAAIRAAGEDEEALLDAVRRHVGEQRFLIGAQLVEGALDPLEAARAYGALAEATVAALAEAVAARFEAVQGHVPGAGLLVLAMGRLGGGMLTDRSDLDLQYLHSGAADADVAGAPRPALAGVHFTRLAQRLTSALSAPTAAGALYEVDTRLRPSGSKGPLVPTIEAFAAYQRAEAWTVEHMALTRARVLWGRPEDRAAVEGVIAEVLTRPRQRGGLLRDALAIRAEMERARPGAGDLLEVKLGPGGLIDLEFVVHAEQLASGKGLTPDLGAAIDALAAAGQLDPALREAHDLLTRALVVMRLVSKVTHGPVEELRPASLSLLARGCGQDDADALRPALGRAKAVVERAWRATFGQDRRDLS
jgi:glutamate-ammonia-ligase adenylyltransferase